MNNHYYDDILGQMVKTPPWAPLQAAVSAPKSKTPFFMVYGEGKSAPTVKHGDIIVAEAEARRLAIANPGTKFFVLKPLEFAFADKPEATFRPVG